MDSLEKLRTRLKDLDDIETDVGEALQAAGQALSELGKEKTAMESVKTNVQKFSQTMNNVGRNLSKQIIYLSQVSTVNPHEGSNYAAKKIYHMALHRLEHVRSRINDLELVREEHSKQGEPWSPVAPPQNPPWVKTENP